MYVYTHIYTRSCIHAHIRAYTLIRAVRTHPVTETSHNPGDDHAYVTSERRVYLTAGATIEI